MVETAVADVRDVGVAVFGDQQCHDRGGHTPDIGICAAAFKYDTIGFFYGGSQGFQGDFLSTVFFELRHNDPCCQFGSQTAAFAAANTVAYNGEFA
jgi:hypothetical protein